MLVKSYNGIIRVYLWWRNLSFEVYLYMCKNLSGNLEFEVNYRGITPDKPIAIIPVDIIASPLELLQGAIHYKLYSHRIRRIKNRGLVLALLSVGEKQLEKLIDFLEDGIRAGSDYYVVAVDTDLGNREACVPISFKHEDLKDLDPGKLGKLVKNVDVLLSLI